MTTSGITQTEITLNWTKPARATSYEVNGGALTEWTALGDVAEYEFTGLTANTAYTLQVRAVNSGGMSAAASISASALPNPPTSPTTSDITVNSIKLSWTASVGGAASYEVSSDGGTNWVDSGADTEHTFTGLSSSTAYVLQARAKNSSGVSAAVSAASATTLTPSATPTPKPIFSTCGLLPPSILVTGYHAVTQCRQVDHRGVGISEVINAGVVDAVDVWAYIPPNLEVCFRNQGSLVILDAANAPRFAEPLPYYLWRDLTCSIVDRAGTVVLLRNPLFPGAPVPSPSPAPRLGNCTVTLRALLNFRDAPAGDILRVLPAGVRLTALERRPGWFKVDWHGEQGWVSADYVDEEGDCG